MYFSRIKFVIDYYYRLDQRFSNFDFYRIKGPSTLDMNITDQLRSTKNECLGNNAYYIIRHYKNVIFYENWIRII